MNSSSEPSPFQTSDVLSRYSWSARRRYREHIANMAMELHLEAVRSGTAEISAEDIDEAYRSLRRNASELSWDFAITLAVLPMSIGALFTVYAVPAESRPQPALLMAWILFGVGLILGGMVVRRLIDQIGFVRQSRGIPPDGETQD